MQEGSKTHARYEKYCEAGTVKEALELGATRADIRYCGLNGFLKNKSADGTVREGRGGTAVSGVLFGHARHGVTRGESQGDPAEHFGLLAPEPSRGPPHQRQGGECDGRKRNWPAEGAERG